MALRKSLLLAVSAASILVSAAAFANEASTDATATTEAAAPVKHKGAHKGEHKGHVKGEHKGKHAHPKKDQSAAKDVVAPATDEAK